MKADQAEPKEEFGEGKILEVEQILKEMILSFCD
jgi:hypothetical protein